MVQVEELGTIESPIVLTNTLAVGAALDATVRWTIGQSGNENVRSPASPYSATGLRCWHQWLP